MSGGKIGKSAGGQTNILFSIVALSSLNSKILPELPFKGGARSKRMRSRRRCRLKGEIGEGLEIGEVKPDLR